MESQKALAKLAKRTNGHGRVIEIGSWEGRSTVALAHAVWPASVEAVDTWEGSPGEISAELAAQRDVLGQFMANVTDLTRGNIRVHRQPWREYAASGSEAVRFLFIDAEHTYREVFDTITAFRPLMVPGGVICGDDAHHPPIMQAVRELLDPVGYDATLWWWECP